MVSIEDDDRAVVVLLRGPGSEKAAELRLDDADAFFLRVIEGVLNFLLAVKIVDT